MNKVAHYLQEHVQGEVITSSDARAHFAADGSVLTVAPQVIVYPRTEQDVRKTTRFTWQLAERNHLVPLTPRGLGSDTVGAALGEGIIMVLPAHMNKIIELDPKRSYVIVQPGITLDKLQQTLLTHGRFLPIYPEALQYATIGGVLGSNGVGVKSLKYGDMREITESLRVVLANGEVIETHRLSKKDLSRKMGESTFEGEVYRQLDALISDNWALIDETHKKFEGVEHNAAGYDLYDVKGDDGSFDLTPLLVGSEGTLGVITEATINVEAHSPNTTLLAAYFDDASLIAPSLDKLLDLKPSALELVDGNVLQFVAQQSPNYLRGLIDQTIPKAVVLIEFDEDKDSARKKAVKKARKILEGATSKIAEATDPNDVSNLWKLRECVAVVLSQQVGSARAVAGIEDSALPPSKFIDGIQKIYELFKTYNLSPLVWGSAGDGVIHVEPFFDLGQTGDRQRLFRIMDEWYKYVIENGGTTTAGNGDGRLRTPYLEALYGADMYALFGKLKLIFDPYTVLNPGIKQGTTLESLRRLLRPTTSPSKQFDHLPRR